MINSDTVAKNLKNKRVWRRLIYIALFAIAFNIVEIILWALLAVQFLAQLFSGKPIERATVFGQNLASFAYQIICFLTFRTDETPWPFTPWPEGPPADLTPAEDFSIEPTEKSSAKRTEKSATGGTRKRAQAAKAKSTTTAEDTSI